MFVRLNNHQVNIKFTIEVNPSKLTNINGAYKLNFYRKTKLTLPWTSKTPKRYKLNTINGDLHPSKRISSNFDEGIPLTIEKFLKADYMLMSFKRVKYVEIKVSYTHLVCLKLQNLSYPLKYPTVNSMKFNQNIFDEIS